LRLERFVSFPDLFSFSLFFASCLSISWLRYSLGFGLMYLGTVKMLPFIRSFTTTAFDDDLPRCDPWFEGCEKFGPSTSETIGGVLTLTITAPTDENGLPMTSARLPWRSSQSDGISNIQPLPTSDGLDNSITQLDDPSPQATFTGFTSQPSIIRTSISTSRSQTASPSQLTSVTTQDPSQATVATLAGVAAGDETKGLSAGAVTGIAIGTFIIGAAIAFAAAFFLFRQRNKHKNANVSTKDYPSYADSAPDLGMMQHKGVGSLGGRHSPYVQVSQTPMPAMPTTALSPPMITPAAVANESSKDVTSFLPPAADDDEVWNGVSHLFSMMHEHIEKFYRDVHACITPSMKPSIAKFGIKDVDMAELLQECSSPTAALKHALVAYVLGITGPKQKGAQESTLFPEELAHVANGADVGSGKPPSLPLDPRKALSSHPILDPDFIAATSLHRRVSVYLYSTITGYPNRRKSWMAQSETREAAEHFSLTFFPWANPTSSDQDRDDDLARIITDTLTVRIWLFGQLDTYEFEWEGVGERGIVINPELVKRKWRSDSRDGGGDGDVVVHVVDGTVVAM